MRVPGLRWRLAGILAVAALGLGPSAAHPARDPYGTLDVEAVAGMLGAPDVRIYDANPRDVYEENHLPGAVHVGKQRLEPLLPADRSARLVFYCAGPK
jgi:hypothetical protein